MRKVLLEHFGSAEAIFAAAPEELLGVGRAGKKLASLIADDAIRDEADDVIELCRRRSVRIVPEGDACYPPLLSRIDDPPGLLFVRGEILPRDALAVAIVGARHATAYGLKVAEQLAGSLARAGYTVVSGLARGIDAAAHRGAMAAGGRTVAVLGSGVLSVYPPEHETLAEEVVGHGAVVSECPPEASPFAGAFPQRNRIVSGMCLGTVVVQASERSGALITARLAGEQGREVFAVPGPIDCRVSKGCHELIRDGAKLVGGIDDILEELGPLFETAVSPAGEPVPRPTDAVLDGGEREVFDAIGEGEISIDEVVDATGLPAAEVLAAVSMLEVRRLVRRLAGNRVTRR
jgi:DNA processing protein